jgi:alpha-L-fucosidase
MKKPLFPPVLPALALASIAQLTAAETIPQAPVPFDSPVKATAETEKRVAWWREAKFGMFIHWGLYAIPGKGEWVMWNNQINVSDYSKLADRFSAPEFSGKAWAKTAKEAGMKYMVMTTKHHDGFAMFDSKADPFNAMNSAAHRDFVKEYADAAREAGMRVGFYYSPLDWRFPGYFFPDLYRDNAEAMREKYHRQVTELMTRYGTIDILWYDGGGSN